MPPEKLKTDQKKPPGIFSLLKPYGGLIILLLLFSLFSNGINLLLPKIIAGGIDAYTHKTFDVKHIITQFSLAVGLILYLLTCKVLYRLMLQNE